MSKAVAVSIEAFADRAQLAAGASRLIADALRSAIAARGEARFVATGGSTPGETYDLLAQARLDWSRVQITLSDERWVDVASDQSNEHFLRTRLLVGPAAAARLIGLKARRGGVNDGAKSAARAIAPLMPFDLVLLGMGEDGHIASLFPGHPALEEGMSETGEALCIGVAPAAPAPDLPRVSLTLAALLRAHEIIVLIAGPAKRAVIERGGDDLPVSALFRQRRAPVRVLWSA